MTPNKQLRFEISQTGVESGRRRRLRRGGGGGGWEINPPRHPCGDALVGVPDHSQCFLVQLRAGGAPSGGFPSESLPQTPSLPTPQNREKQNLHTFHTKTLFFRANGYITSAPRVARLCRRPPFWGVHFPGSAPKWLRKSIFIFD